MQLPQDPVSDPLKADPSRSRLPVLASTQILGGVSVASGVAVGGLLAERLSGRTSMAGLAQTAGVLGGAILAVPLANLAHRRGRAPALALGYLVAAAGAATILLAAALGSFWLMLAGTAAFGGGTTSGLQSRYAATDFVAPQRRGRILSLVVWAATVGSVIGPNLSGIGGSLGAAIGLPRLAGPYLFSLAGFLLAATLVMRLPDGRRPAGDDAARPSLRTTWDGVIASPRAYAGMIAMACAHSVMVGVMVMTPVHLGHGGSTLRVIGLVISLHIVGMYALSPVMGWLTDTISPPTTLMIGALILLAALIVTAGAADHETVRTTIGLVLIGVGWSACLVAGSTQLSANVGEETRTATQGLGDLAIGIAGAVAGLVSGPIMAAAGYRGLNLSAFLLLVPLMALVLWAEIITMMADKYLRNSRRR